MIKKLLFLTTCSFVANIVNGCKQVTVSKFANQDKITDYLTETDEVTMRFGVGKVVAFQYSNFFIVDESIDVPANKITFPCLHDEAFYFYVMERDEL